MSSGKLLGAVIVLSIAWSAPAQPAPQKPKPAKKPAAAAKPAEKAPTPAPAPPKDLKIRTKYVNGAQASENTTYMKGVRQRFEFPGVPLIPRCNLKRSVLLHDPTKHYMVVRADTPVPEPAEPAATPAPGD